MRTTLIKWTLPALIALTALACSDETDVTNCPEGQERNPVSGECRPGGDNPNDPDGGDPGDAGDDTDGGGDLIDADHPHDGRDDLEPWEDESGDGVPNQYDNCPFVHNPDQLDSDGDGIGDACDNCPDTSNTDQAAYASNPVDERGIIMGNACAPGVEYVDTVTDSDSDGIPDVMDNCPNVANADQADSDGDSIGDACDNCPFAANVDQTASPGNPTGPNGLVVGDACAPEPGQIPICEEQTTEFERLNPNVYVVLDLSGSMDWGVGGQNDHSRPNRWERAVAGMNTVTNELAGEIRFGVGSFTGSCNTNALTNRLSMGDHNATTIQNAYNSLDPNGGTPLDYALQNVLNNDRVSDPGDSLDDQRVKSVLLITDGEPGCGGVDGAEDVIEDLRDRGVYTFVVGFAFNSPSLQRFATAGGTGSPYLASDANQLANAVRDISNILVSCSYNLDQTPPDPNQIWVSVNGTYLPQADISYNGNDNVLTLSESACSQVRSIDAEALDLQIKMGCANACVPEQPTGLCDIYYQTCGEPLECESCSAEICDGVDNNCDGRTDEGCPECSINGSSCESDADCCGNLVCGSEGTCGFGCFPTNVACTSNADCCSGQCAPVSGSEFGSCIVG
ncbi:VWA domain-containing protein [Lujinxingia vulgaris]|uniref:VWA domain-containing protein n=1 Tax=Lujinxingia vulgaris TaxID=2600176 RepID=A0A5C6WZE9_9DELT|nr:VWA domain-containing protein [Lujinxingia vulgaris]